MANPIIFFVKLHHWLDPKYTSLAVFHILFFNFNFQTIALHACRFTSQQKQSFADILQNRCFWKVHNFHRKTPVLESLLHKFARPEALKGPQIYYKETATQVFFVKFAKISRTEHFGRCFWSQVYILLLFFSETVHTRISAIIFMM